MQLAADGHDPSLDVDDGLDHVAELVRSDGSEFFLGDRSRTIRMSMYAPWSLLVRERDRLVSVEGAYDCERRLSLSSVVQNTELPD